MNKRQITHFADDATIERLTRYERALNLIVRNAPRNGEDVSYLLAKNALDPKPRDPEQDDIPEPPEQGDGFDKVSKALWADMEQDDVDK